MNYCYHCYRLPWPPPSPFPLGVTINLPSSCLLPKDSQTPPLASPALLKAKNKGTRSQGRMELRPASHWLTCFSPQGPTNTMEGAKIPENLNLLQILNSFLSDFPKLPITRNQLMDGKRFFESNRLE